MNNEEQLKQIDGYLNDLKEFKQLSYVEIMESREFKNLFWHISIFLMDNLNLAIICNTRVNYFKNLYCSNESLFVKELQKTKEIILKLLDLLDDKKLKKIKKASNLIAIHSPALIFYLADYFKQDFTKADVEENFNNALNLYNDRLKSAEKKLIVEEVNLTITGCECFCDFTYIAGEWLSWLGFYEDFLKELNHFNSHFIDSSVFTNENEWNDLYKQLDCQFSAKMYETPKKLYVDSFVIFNKLRSKLNCNDNLTAISLSEQELKDLIKSAIRVLKELENEIIKENKESAKPEKQEEKGICEKKPENKKELPILEDIQKRIIAYIVKNYSKKMVSQKISPNSKLKSFEINYLNKIYPLFPEIKTRGQGKYEELQGILNDYNLNNLKL